MSKAITPLEERLGDNLFVQSTHDLTLTVGGETNLAGCIDALEILRDRGGTWRARRRVKGAPADRYACGVRAPVLVPLLAEMCLEHPGLQLTLRFTDRLIDPVGEGVDVVVRFGRPGTPQA